MLAPSVKELRAFCHANETEFIMDDTVFTDSFGSFYTHIDNGSNVLGVCHLDTVFDNEKTPFYIKKTPFRIFSPKLDDRLGAYILCRILPQFSVNVDILFTTNEEYMQSTARDFIVPSGKQYNWIFSFDRRGNGAVMYQYDNPDSEKLLARYGIPLLQGSYSDIAELDFMGVKGFNFGTGYHKEHTKQCHTVWHETIRNVEKFVNFYNDNKDVYMEHIQDDNLTSWYDARIKYDALPYSSTFYDEINNQYRVHFCEYCGDNIQGDEISEYDKTGLCSTCITGFLNGTYK